MPVKVQTWRGETPNYCFNRRELIILKVYL